MKIRRKTQQCLNCGLTLNTVYNFCPRCGQENNDNNVSFGTFVREFFANYFSFDTRFGHSIVPFLIKPGYLTNRFIDGQRVSYVHPLRLYLILSIIFFFLATWSVRSSLEEISIESASMSEDVKETDSVRAFIGLRMVMSVLEDESLSDQAALDSLKKMDSFEIDSSGLSMRGFHQIRRVAQNDLDVFAGFVLQNMPVMMFMLIPLFALLLKLFYIRTKKRLYVQHLTHALHLHAFTLCISSIQILLFLAVGAKFSESVIDWFIFLISLILAVYALFSFRRVYQQGWVKTVVKLLMIGMIYSMILLVFGLSEAIISFMLF